jgi:uncharacterized membrane protein
VADADKAVQQPEEERPSTDAIAQRLGAAEAEGDNLEAQREVEFAAAERLMFFSDAVIAIALTLLALELPVPGGTDDAQSVTMSEMLRDAREHFNDYLAFLISYVVIASHWRIHHRVFRYVREATSPIIRLNLLWLLFIVITPFTTKMLSAGSINLLRFAGYAGTQAIQFGIFTLISLLIVRGQHVRAGTDLERFRRGRVMTIAMAAAFAISIPLYPLFGQGAFVIWAAVPFLTSLVLRRVPIVKAAPT